jgi:hypothetical protein
LSFTIFVNGVGEGRKEGEKERRREGEKERRGKRLV